MQQQGKNLLFFWKRLKGVYTEPLCFIGDIIPADRGNPPGHCIRPVVRSKFRCCRIGLKQACIDQSFQNAGLQILAGGVQTVLGGSLP